MPDDGNVGGDPWGLFVSGLAFLAVFVLAVAGAAVALGTPLHGNGWVGAAGAVAFLAGVGWLAWLFAQD